MKRPLHNFGIILFTIFIDIKNLSTKSVDEIVITSWRDLDYSKFLSVFMFITFFHKPNPITIYFFFAGNTPLQLLAFEIDLTIFNLHKFKHLISLPMIISNTQIIIPI